MFNEKVQILYNNQIAYSYYKLGMHIPEGYQDAIPGQFIMLRLHKQMTPLLSRPFSIHRLVREENRVIGIEILYKVVGQCTKKLSEQKEGDFIQVIGPLGNGFKIPENINRIFLVSGGIGVAPLVFLAQNIKKHLSDSLECLMFLGGRSNDDLLCQDEFASMGICAIISTDDGSVGEKGLITQPLERIIQNKPPDLICACGPMGMLKSVAKISENYKIACQVSIETVMACGMGACLGCAVESRDQQDKYLHVCVDGPVFDTRVLKI